MQLLDSLDTIGRQEWLDAPSDGVQRVVTSALHSSTTAKQIDNLLNGTWLGHPLHPILVEIPVGAWTVGLTLDAVEVITGKRELGPGADAATLIGLLGALGSAVTGLAQWQYTVGRSRRLGMAHALLNVAGTALYGASVLSRVRGWRGAGRVTALLGYAVTTVSAYVGGDLVYGERLGVVHVPEQEGPSDFTPALDAAELGEGQMRAVEVQGSQVLLARTDGEVYALGNICAHLGGPLNEGKLDTAARCVECPWHQSRFALEDGRVLDGPATFPQPHYETQIREGKIEVRWASQ